jgi:outer membrane biosynthesis protein TonB
MIRLFTTPLVLNFWASPYHVMDSVYNWDAFRSDRRASTANVKALVSEYSRAEACAFAQGPQPLPEYPTDVPVPEPHDVPVPEPHDVPVPEPIDDPPPDPGKYPPDKSPSEQPPKRPGQDPKPRPVP